MLVNTIYLRKSLVGGEFVDGFISIGGFFVFIILSFLTVVDTISYVDPYHITDC